MQGQDKLSLCFPQLKEDLNKTKKQNQDLYCWFQMVLVTTQHRLEKGRATSSSGCMKKITMKTPLQ